MALKKLQSLRFRDLDVKECFIFKRESDEPNSGLATGPWRKVSARKYQHIETGMMCRIGSIDVEVLLVEDPKTQLKAYVVKAMIFWEEEEEDFDYSPDEVREQEDHFDVCVYLEKDKALLRAARMNKSLKELIKRYPEERSYRSGDLKEIEKFINKHCGHSYVPLLWRMIRYSVHDLPLESD